MSSLDNIVKILESQLLAVRRRFVVRRDERGATIHRGGMQAHFRELDNGEIEIAYEAELHEQLRVRVRAAVAAPLLIAIIQRDRLRRVEVADVEPSTAPESL